MNQPGPKLTRKSRNIFQDSWVWKMAWRDARQNISRLMLFAASLVTGIGAVVAISSLNYSLKDAIDENAKELLGADLVVQGNRMFEKEVFDSFDSIKTPQAFQVQTSSMVMFMSNQQSRLTQVMSFQGDFPFYGNVDTEPANGYDKIKTGRYALIDESLAQQFGVTTKDSIKIGSRFFKVAGTMQKMPGITGGAFASLAPSVYISKSGLDSTGLIQFGSRIQYKHFFKIGNDEQTKVVADKLEPILSKNRLRGQTVASRKAQLGQVLTAVYSFFSLLAFVALILGCIGVASSVHIYAREKREEVAVLRCVGSSGWQAFNIYFIQVFVVGLIGSVFGSLLGIGAQQVIPIILKDYIPIELNFMISWQSVGQGILLGTVVSALFTLLPLVTVRFVPPLTVLRTDFEPGRIFSKTRLFAITMIVLFPIVAAWYQTGSILAAIFFTLGLVIALGSLTLVAMLLLYLIRKFFPKNSSFIFRHALSNLFRPNNQTRVLMVTIGLGAFIITTLNVVQSSILSQAEFLAVTTNSNAIMFDIQTSQKDGIVKLIENHHLPLNQITPMINTRLVEIKGKSVDVLFPDTIRNRGFGPPPGGGRGGGPRGGGPGGPGRFRREYSVTYRDKLNSAEILTKGKIPELRHGQKDSVWITMDEDLLESLKVEIGDSVMFEMQGVRIAAFIGGFMKVDAGKQPPNFSFVFPLGILEDAPQAWVAATRIDNQLASTAFQKDLVMEYPTVSFVDMKLILDTVNQLFDKIGLIIRFLASFSIITGLVVLASAVLNSKFVRIKENVLLRTIGARTRQITMITIIEYAYLGLFASLTGILLSLGAGLLLTKFFFEVAFAFDPATIALIGLGVIALTITIGWWNSRQVINTPPLQVLRKEN